MLADDIRVLINVSETIIRNAEHSKLIYKSDYIQGMSDGTISSHKAMVENLRSLLHKAKEETA